MRAGGQTKRELERHAGLPAEVSSLVGRGPQIAAILEGLRTARVVTLTGPGGCGKTRLALRAATLAADRFGDGAWLVELASLTDSALVPAAIAEALGVPGEDAANPMTGVVQALAEVQRRTARSGRLHILDQPAGRWSCWPGGAAGCASWPPAGNAWTCPASSSSPCRR